MRRKIENRCSNCIKRGECKDRGEVVEWVHCRQFEVDTVLAAKKQTPRLIINGQDYSNCVCPCSLDDLAAEGVGNGGKERDDASCS